MIFLSGKVLFFIRKLNNKSEMLNPRIVGNSPKYISDKFQSNWLKNEGWPPKTKILKI